jgi:hypothetical protein
MHTVTINCPWQASKGVREQSFSPSQFLFLSPTLVKFHDFQFLVSSLRQEEDASWEACLRDTENTDTALIVNNAQESLLWSARTSMSCPSFGSLSIPIQPLDSEVPLYNQVTYLSDFYGLGRRNSAWYVVVETALGD